MSEQWAVGETRFLRYFRLCAGEDDDLGTLVLATMIVDIEGVSDPRIMGGTK